MKHALAFAVLLLTQPLHAADEDKPVLVTCGKDTVVLDGYESPDKRYALGWTIRPVGEDASPVDWSKLGEGNPLIFWSNYLDEYEEAEKSKYTGVVGVLDLSRKTFKDLPGSDAYFYGSRRSVDQQWVDEKTAFVQIDARFDTLRLYMVKTEGGEITSVDITSTSNEAIGKLIGEKRPLAPEMCIQYSLQDEQVTRTSDGEIHDQVPCKVEGDILHLRFYAGVPKQSYEEITGHLLISLQNGRIIKAVSDDPADVPFAGELGAADQKLNQAYSTLRSRLDANAFKGLVSDQRQWIEDRNSRAFGAGKEAADKFLENEDNRFLRIYHEARNQEALQMTRERTAVLQKRLAGLKVQ